MKKLNSPLRSMIFGTILAYTQNFQEFRPTRWDMVNYLIGYYGAITADHIAAIEVAVREGVVEP